MTYRTRIMALTSKRRVNFLIMMHIMATNCVLSSANFAAISSSAFLSSGSQLSTVLIRSMQEPMQVNIGGRVALEERHLLILERARHGQHCVVEVDTVDASYQRVGQMYPKRFDCFYEAGSVQYEHEGSPLIQTDSIKVFIYYFFGAKNNSIVENAIIKVNIKPFNGSLDLRIIQNGEEALFVNNFKESSQIISSNIVRFRYNPLQEFCLVRYMQNNYRASSGRLAYFRDWPIAGRLVTDEGHEVPAFELDCHHFLLMGYRYQHLRPPSPAEDYIPLEVEVQSFMAKELILKEYVFLPIIIRNGQKNTAPKLSIKDTPLILKNSGNAPLALNQVGKDFFTALDHETRTENIVLQLISLQKTPNDEDSSRTEDLTNNLNGNDAGASLVHLNEPSRTIRAFTLRDFVDGNVAFQKLTLNGDGNYFMKLQPIDTHFQAGQIIPVLLQCQLEDNLRFQIFVKPVYIFTQGAIQLRPENIQSSLSPTDSLINFKIRNLPKNGELRANGMALSSFNSNQLLATLSSTESTEQFESSHAGLVYSHNGSLPVHDSIRLRAMYQLQQVVFNLPIHVVTIWKRQNTLKSMAARKIIKGGQICFGLSLLKESYLRALALDQVNIVYQIKSLPRSGWLAVVRASHMNVPQTSQLFTFQLQDLRQNFLCYRHAGLNTSPDAFQLQQQGNADFPMMLVQIAVEDVIHNALSLRQLTRNMPELRITETERYLPLTEHTLDFGAAGVPRSQILYTLDVFPQFTDATNNATLDAGRLVDRRRLRRESVTGDGHKTKSNVQRLEELATMSQWSQEDIYDSRILYIPPLNDIGYSTRSVIFYYSVRDNTTNKVLSYFNVTIIITPVDNKAPSLKQGSIVVQRGKSLILSSKHLIVFDIDTVQERLFLSLAKTPKHGQLEENGQRMLPNHRFRSSAIGNGKISYKHNASPSSLDYFVLQVTDGFQNSEPITVYVNVTQRTQWNYGTTFYANETIFVREGATVLLHQRMFPKSLLAETQPQNVAFFLAQRPTKGNILRDNGPVTQFTFNDLKQQRVKYAHAGEIGPVAITDMAQVMMLENNHLQSHMLNFSIEPVNNQAPKILVQGQLLVREGGEALVSYNVLNAEDADTLAKDLNFRVVDRPNWGELLIANERREPLAFNLEDIRQGRVTYVQNRNQGTEQTHDQFRVVLSDGERRTSPTSVEIYIHPANDESPILMLKNFALFKGQERVLDESIFTIKDIDLPRDELRIRVTKLPRLGVLQQRWKLSKVVKNITADQFSSFTKRNLNNMQLVYVQTEPMKYSSDSFTVEVSDSIHIVQRTCVVALRANNEKGPILQYEPTFQVYAGDFKIIDEAVLLVLDPDTPNDQLTFKILQQPTYGFLELRVARNDLLPGGKREIEVAQRLGNNAIFSQRDVELGKLQYSAGVLSSNMTDMFELSCSDTADAHVLSPIRLTAEIKPRPIANHLKVVAVASPLKVPIGSGVSLTVDQLSVTYGIDVVPPAQIKITCAESCINIYKENEQLMRGSALFMADILFGVVTVNASSCAKVNRQVVLTVNAEYRGVRATGNLILNVHKLDVHFPTVLRLLPVSVISGKKINITSAHLKVTDQDTVSPDIKFTIQTLPRKGRLFLNGSEIFVASTFSQQDIDDGALQYANEAGPNNQDFSSLSSIVYDSMVFTISDTRPQIRYWFRGIIKTEALTLLIEIKVDEASQPLRLIINRAPIVIRSFGGENHGFNISNTFLKATPGNVIFTITRQPQWGKLELIGREMDLIREFTQNDIDAGRLVYVLNRPSLSQETSDYFNFRLLSADRKQKSPTNEMESFRFLLEWSLIQLTSARYKISCDRAGTLSINVRRTGAVDQMAFVTFTLNQNGERSALPNVDYEPVNVRSVDFSPGQGMSPIRVYINKRRRDRLQKRLRFNVELRSPGNAVLGSPIKALIVLMPIEETKSKASSGACNEAYFQAAEAANPGLGYQYINFVKQSRISYFRDQSYDGDNKTEKKSLSTSKSSSEIDLPPDKSLPDLQQPKSHWNMELPSESELNKISMGNSDATEGDELAIQQLPKCNVRDNYLAKRVLPSGDVFLCNGYQWIRKTRQRTCPTGWLEHANLCYKSFRNRVTWLQAHRSCATLKSSLPIINSQKDLNWFRKVLKAGRKYWIGLRHTGERWMYEDGSALFYRNWDASYPRPIRHVRNCVFINNNKYFRNRPCDKNKYKYVCMKVKE